MISWEQQNGIMKKDKRKPNYEIRRNEDLIEEKKKKVKEKDTQVADVLYNRIVNLIKYLWS
jgi:hypothetical protein